MRFKKLRISIIIALVLFIFVAGSIIVFGEIAKNQQLPSVTQTQNFVAPTDNRNNITQQIANSQTAVTATPQNKSTTVTKTDAVNNTQPVKIQKSAKTLYVSPAQPPPQPVIYHPVRRTRAS